MNLDLEKINYIYGREILENLIVMKKYVIENITYFLYCNFNRTT